MLNAAGCCASHQVLERVISSLGESFDTCFADLDYVSETDLHPLPPSFEPCGMRDFIVFLTQRGPHTKRKSYSEEQIIAIVKEHA